MGIVRDFTFAFYMNYCNLVVHYLHSELWNTVHICMADLSAKPNARFRVLQYDEEMTEWKTGKRAEKPKFHLFGCAAAPGASLESM